jgi:hypothetical protein
MKSATLPSFWSACRLLDETIRRRARKVYRLWISNPFHRSLRFKCINPEEKIWSVRITHRYRGIGVLEDDTVTWFWIGSHDNYERFFS